MKEVTAQIIMQKMFDKWADENPGMMEDIIKLASEINFFNMKWGAKLEPKDFLSSEDKDNKN